MEGSATVAVEEDGEATSGNKAVVEVGSLKMTTPITSRVIEIVDE